jgi:SpoIID/LytB domain protein
MNVTVGIVEKRGRIDVELLGAFVDAAGRRYAPGTHRFEDAVQLTPADEALAAFAVEDVTIGVGFHWERNERQTFRGALRILRGDGLTLINDVPLEDYVASVISSEMSASCPIELLKAHAVMSRSWLRFPHANPETVGAGNHSETRGDEIVRWYGRETHLDFDVCADDHCQRYQGITRTFSPAAAAAVRATAGEFLLYGGKICDARFSKSCGGVTEEYRSAWDDREVPYLSSVVDGDYAPPPDHERAILNREAPAFCNTHDPDFLAQILPGFDQETRDFHRWSVTYSSEEIRAFIQKRYAIDPGAVTALEPLARGPSGRITRLRVVGALRALTISKELEIRRALSTSHLYSSAFVVEPGGGQFTLRGAGWGHGVGLCQIGAAVMATHGKTYREILAHYYRGTAVSTLG